MECKVRGFSLNSRGIEQVNFAIVRQNVIDEIQDPLVSGKARQTEVTKPYHIVRNAKEYSPETVSQTKKYQLMYSKRVIDPATFLTYLYGYLRYIDEDEEMAELLCNL